MINLKLQIISICYSFLYGIFFYLTLIINNKVLFNTKIFLKIILSLVFIMFHVVLYFLILREINCGILHIYFVFSLIIGSFVCKWGSKRFIKK